MSKQLYQPNFDRMYDDERQWFDGLVKYGRLTPVTIQTCEHGVQLLQGTGHQLNGNLWCRPTDTKPADTQNVREN